MGSSAPRGVTEAVATYTRPSCVSVIWQATWARPSVLPCSCIQHATRLGIPCCGACLAGVGGWPIAADQARRAVPGQQLIRLVPPPALGSAAQHAHTALLISSRVGYMLSC